MRPDRIRPLQAALLLVAGLATAEPVKEIRVVRPGPEAAPLDPGIVQGYATIRVGDELERAALSRDMRNMEKSGRFAYAAVDVERVAGGLAVIYRIAPMPRIRRLVVDGADELGNRKVRDWLELGVGDPVGDTVLAARAVKVREEYRKKFFPFTELDWTIDEDESSGTADVKIQVKEGARAHVRHIEFEGNEAVGDSVLRKSMLQREYAWWISWLSGRGTYKPDDVAADRETIRRAYLDRGHLDARVGEPEIRLAGDSSVDVYIPVSEGPVYRIGEIRIEGATKVPPTDLQKVLTNGPGAIASLAALESGQQAMQDVYGSRGYLGSRAAYEIIPRGTDTVADLNFRVREGELAYIRDIHIRGNTRTKDKVIRRELTVYPDEAYNSVRLRNSERRLRNLGFFDHVAAVPEETDDPRWYDLVFDVEEQKTGNLLFGVGYSSVEEVMGFVELTQGNFDLTGWPPTGGGQKLKLRGTVGTKRRDLELSFVEPWFLDRKLSFGVDLYKRNRGYLSDSYDQLDTGGSVTLGKPLDAFTRLNFTYGLQSTDITDVDESAPDMIREEEGKTLKSYVQAQIVRDSRDSAFVATRGNRTSLSGTLAGGPLGADVDIYDLEVQTSHYVPLWYGHVLNVRGWMEVVDVWSDGTRVPMFDRLYLGGQRTLRGFRFRDVGPHEDDEPSGGQSGWYGIIEYTIPVVEKLRFAGFYDIGMVYDEPYEFEWSEYNSDAGIGLRLDFPGFPLRFDYAWPLETDPHNDRSSPRFTFSIGYAY